jgi:hypothetical protein
MWNLYEIQMSLSIKFYCSTGKFMSYLWLFSHYYNDIVEYLWSRLYGPQTLKYLLSCLFKKFNLIFIIILLYRGYIVTFTKVLAIYLRFTPSIFLFSPPSPLLRTVSIAIVQFHSWIHKYFHHICPPLPFLMPSPLPLPTPQQEMFYLPVLHLKKTPHFCLFIMGYTGNFTVTFLCVIPMFILSISLRSTKDFP